MLALRLPAFAGVEGLREAGGLPSRGACSVGEAGGDQLRIACIKDEIRIVAKLEKVSETAYGKMI